MEAMPSEDTSTTHHDWKTAAEAALSNTLTALTPLGGGDFAAAYRATLGTGQGNGQGNSQGSGQGNGQNNGQGNGQHVFIKTHANPPPHFFSTEAAGLQWLRDTGTVSVPKVLAFNDAPPFLVMEWVSVGSSKPTTEPALGRAMAALHQTPMSSFGRTDQRTTGSLAVPNTPCDSWVEFYATQRLLPLAQKAFDRQVLPAAVINRLESLAHNLAALNVPDEPPSLLHGDLWAGNRLIDTAGQSWLIDPAAHAGHREFDLGMMQLFGGFERACFHAYDECYPLAPGWQDRVELHQLAPLIVHAIKFGGHYVQACTDVIKRFT